MKAKSVIVIVATLLIGFVLGFLTNGQLTRQRFQRFVHQGSYEGFKVRVMDIIRPDQKQIKVIEPILDKYAEKVEESVSTSRLELKSLHEEMLNELKPYLDTQQLARLEHVHQKFERGWKMHRQGPPHDRPRHQRRGR